jgi:hypothetical protein
MTSTNPFLNATKKTPTSSYTRFDYTEDQFDMVFKFAQTYHAVYADKVDSAEVVFKAWTSADGKRQRVYVTRNGKNFGWLERGDYQIGNAQFQSSGADYMRDAFAQCLADAEAEFNPAPVVEVVETVETLETEAEAAEREYDAAMNAVIDARSSHTDAVRYMSGAVWYNHDEAKSNLEKAIRELDAAVLRQAHAKQSLLLVRLAREAACESVKAFVVEAIDAGIYLWHADAAKELLDYRQRKAAEDAAHVASAAEAEYRAAQDEADEARLAYWAAQHAEDAFVGSGGTDEVFAALQDASWGAHREWERLQELADVAKRGWDDARALTPEGIADAARRAEIARGMAALHTELDAEAEAKADKQSGVRDILAELRGQRYDFDEDDAE